MTPDQAGKKKRRKRVRKHAPAEDGALYSDNGNLTHARYSICTQFFQAMYVPECACGVRAMPGATIRRQRQVLAQRTVVGFSASERVHAHVVPSSVCIWDKFMV